MQLYAEFDEKHPQSVDMKCILFQDIVGLRGSIPFEQFTRYDPIYSVILYSV